MLVERNVYMFTQTDQTKRYLTLLPAGNQGHKIPFASTIQEWAYLPENRGTRGNTNTKHINSKYPRACLRL